jgi:hypothetical protein
MSFWREYLSHALIANEMPLILSALKMITFGRAGVTLDYTTARAMVSIRVPSTGNSHPSIETTCGRGRVRAR